MNDSKPRAVVFDVNETLIDISGLGRAMRDVGLDANELPLVFARVLRDGFAMAAAGAYGDFSSILRHHLMQIAPANADEVSRRVDRVMDALPGLELHEDVELGLRRLRQRGYRIATLTNGNADIIRSIFDRNGLTDLVERIMDVTAVKAWKPMSEPYEDAARELELPLQRMAMVAVHPWDMLGARRAGMMTAWLNRSGDRFPEYIDAPDLQARTLPELADAFERADFG